jgi:hypothetical protein
MSLYTSLFHDVDPPSTLENASVGEDELPEVPDAEVDVAGEEAAVAEEETEDSDAYYARLMQGLERGRDRLEKVKSETSA